MTLKIEIASDGDTATFRLSGRIEETHLVELQTEVQRYRPRLVFDLAETTLVDLAVVRYLAAHEVDDVELLRCPRYVREWIARERSQATQRTQEDR
jgi:anti-anti-sigma regulatory factor